MALEKKEQKRAKARIIELERRGVPVQELRRWCRDVLRGVQVHNDSVETVQAMQQANGLTEAEVGCMLAEPDDLERNPDIAEVWSPPRVTANAVKRGLTPRPAIDILTGYNLLAATGRPKA